MYNVGEGHICQDVCVEPEDSSVEVALSFSFYVGSRDKTQPIRPMRQALLPVEPPPSSRPSVYDSVPVNQASVVFGGGVQCASLSSHCTS